MSEAVQFACTLHTTSRGLNRRAAGLCHALRWRAIRGVSSSPDNTSDYKLKLPAFDRDLVTKFTRSPNPSWTWGQKVDSTPHGREWMKGEQQGWETISTAKESASDVYAIMNSGVVPRPIAFVSTVSEDGVENLAPFSWFGMVAHRPPVVAFACLDASDREGQLKDTTRNIVAAQNLARGFVVNIVSEPFIEQANAASIDAPSDVSEWDLSGLTKLPSVHVDAPRVRESAFSMECELYSTVPIVANPSPRPPSDDESATPTTTLVLAHVKYVHVRKDMLTPRGTVDVAKLRPVSRLGENAYGCVGDAFRLPRPSWAKDGEQARRAVGV